MSQITTGVRAILANAAVYNGLQRLMGGKAGRMDFAENVVRADPSARLLDIGCGTGDLLDYLPGTVHYCGWDISEAYIESARSRFVSRGEFHCGLVAAADIERDDPFDIVIASGVLHHLDDDEVASVARLARLALRNGGRFVSIDPVFTPGQNPLARLLIACDRGQHVRSPDGYSDLVRAAFGSVSGTVRHRRWLPYTHWMMEAAWHPGREGACLALSRESDT